MIKPKDKNYLLFYLLLSVFMIVFFLDGYFMMLDWAPNLSGKFQNLVYGIHQFSYGGEYMIMLGSFILSPIIVQKLSVFLIFFLSCTSMHNLIDTKYSIPKYFAGIFYLVNPFVYSRLMVGHWLILLAYSITPFVVKSMMKSLENPEKRQLIKTCLWVSLVAAINMHTLFLVLFLFLALYSFKLMESGNKKQITKSLAIMALLFILLNSYWIIPLVTAKSTIVSRITSDDLAAFETRRGNFNEFMETLMIYGFWRQDAYVQPRNIMPFPIYFLIFATLLFLTIHGYKNCDHKYKNPILMVGISAQVLAVGVGHPWFENIFRFLFDQLYFLRGFREPQKFLALLVFVYAFFCAYGVQSLLKQIKKKKVKMMASCIILSIPFLYTPTMFFSFWGQIHSADYPPDWYEVNNYLNEDEQEYNVLFLPWHLYMDFKWIPNKDKRTVNPANSFFEKPIIQGDNIEVGSIYSSSNNARSAFIQSNLKNLTGEKLKILNVKYIIVAKEADYREYSYLRNGFELVKETENLILFRNNEQVNKFYQSTDLINLKPLDFKKISEINYVISKPTEKNVIFTEAFEENWALGNQFPLQYNGVNIYEFKDAQEIRYKRFSTYLFSYLISLISLIFVIILFRK